MIAGGFAFLAAAAGIVLALTNDEGSSPERRDEAVERASPAPTTPFESNTPEPTQSAAPVEYATINGREIPLQPGMFFGQGAVSHPDLSLKPPFWMLTLDDDPSDKEVSFISFDGDWLLRNNYIYPNDLEKLYPFIAATEWPTPTSPGSITINGTPVALAPGMKFGGVLGVSTEAWAIS
jgi:hypothetical protein